MTTIDPLLIDCELETPIGPLRLVADASSLVGVYFEQHRPAPRALGLPGRSPVLDLAADELAAFLRDPRRRFTVPLAPRGTELERAVWRALSTIPPGATRTYGELAAQLGRPSAARAVGGAVARNPLSIVVPCHRVVGARGALTGFAGGLSRKAWLLAHERPARLGRPSQECVEAPTAVSRMASSPY